MSHDCWLLRPRIKITQFHNNQDFNLFMLVKKKNLRSASVLETRHAQHISENEADEFAF